MKSTGDVCHWFTEAPTTRDVDYPCCFFWQILTFPDVPAPNTVRFGDRARTTLDVICWNDLLSSSFPTTALVNSPAFPSSTHLNASFRKSSVIRERAIQSSSD